MVHKQIARDSGIDGEQIRSAEFPLPREEDIADASSASLLWQAARLTLREGAAPLRSLGRISIRPRIYQFAPLLMALRLRPVRMLIADDVGVGKTIEALLIARELYDRGEIRRLCVLCPPYLCDQWRQELACKFNFEPVVIRSGSAAQLEREKNAAESIYRYYPIQVASIDFLKTDRNKNLFLLDCPDLVIVDEAHGAAESQGNQGQQQRHLLLREIARLPDRHLILVTATPHSGVEAAFCSLLSLIRPEFGQWSASQWTELQRAEIAKHFVQRTRRDIMQEWESAQCFPQRESLDRDYSLSPSYFDLFRKTFDFCSEIVRTGERLDQRHRRVRYWGALALLRCVMSSPAAAIAALESRQTGLLAPETEEQPEFAPLIFESSEDQTDDESPAPAIESADSILPPAERRRLRELARAARALLDTAQDTKLEECARILREILADGGHPIVWCRYIATAEYVAKGLERLLRNEFPALRVLAITGRIGEEERREKIGELFHESCRCLVATDCLSEGINLQELFNAVLHYDLPWNPNRLEQREGRVDRYGQKTPTVHVIRFFGRDNPVDGVVLDVLLNKAREIYHTLGTHAPVPEESETVTQAVLNALFLRGRRRADSQQLELDFAMDAPEVTRFHGKWRDHAQREKINRTRFAQRALKPREVQAELEATDAVLGDPGAVREFLLAAAQRLNIPVSPEKRPDVFRIPLAPEATQQYPEPIRYALPEHKSGQWIITFTSPSPEGAEYLGRNHPFVSALAAYLMEQALEPPASSSLTPKAVARCGALRTRAVSRLTNLLLLRVRYLLERPQQPELLSEEVRVAGFTRATDGRPEWLPHDESLRLLTQAQPHANLPMPEKRELTASLLAAWGRLQQEGLREQVESRARELAESHRRLIRAVENTRAPIRVTPRFPPDLIAILVLQPLVEHNRS